MVEISNLPEYIIKSGGAVDQAGTLKFPESLGNGYLKIIKPSSKLSIMLQHYQVNQSIRIKRNKATDSNDALTFSFRNVMAINSGIQQKMPFKLLPSVQVSTSDVTLDIEVPAHFKTSNIIIKIELASLKQLLLTDNQARIMELVMKKEHSFLYEEVISPQIQSVAAGIFKMSTTDNLLNFYYKIKAEELIYLFLSSLMQRDKISSYPINQNDIDVAYKLREEMAGDMSVPPKLDRLAAKVNMSVSKLGKIFRQIFGDSIYNYYQKIRMQQAAFLLAQKNLSVSETGYQLGFTNLSHFTRLFEKHMGMKPKKYSSIQTYQKLPK